MSIEVAPSCRYCEYFDAEGKNPFLLHDDYVGDCGNSSSPWFTPQANWVCKHFFLNTTLSEQAKSEHGKHV